MKNLIKIFGVIAVIASACNRQEAPATKVASEAIRTDSLAEFVRARNDSATFSCSLPDDELQNRKATVLAKLKSMLKEKKELKDGYAFRFDGTTEVVDYLKEFIITERECCKFFVFTLSVGGDQKEAWLELTGPEGVKDVIENELEM